MDEMVNLMPAAITFADDRAADAGLVAPVLRGETDLYDVDKRYLCKDGRLIWVCVRATLLRDAQGNPEGTALRRLRRLTPRLCSTMRAEDVTGNGCSRTTVPATSLANWRTISRPSA